MPFAASYSLEHGELASAVVTAQVVELGGRAERGHVLDALVGERRTDAAPEPFSGDG